MKKLITILFLFSFLHSFSQDSCVMKIADSLEYKLTNELIIYPAKSDDESIIKIPLVFHVVYSTLENGTERGKISREQVHSAVDNANEFFRLDVGSTALGADMGIEFYLANEDPQGNYTDGILYHDIDSLDITDLDKQKYKDNGISANSNLSASEIAIKGATRWDNQKYYNIWLVTEIDGNGGQFGIIGYAYFPTTSVVDGIVQLSNSTGDKDIGYYDLNGNGTYSLSFTQEGDADANLSASRNLNKTLIHELGHTFGLFHTFHGNSCNETNCNLQGDRVCDTPPTVVNSSCNNPSCVDAQTENHMDYTSQTCRNKFTFGQRTRARLATFNSRFNLVNNFNTVFNKHQTEIEWDIDAPLTRCGSSVSPSIYVRNLTDTTLSSIKLAYGTSVQDSVHYRVALSLTKDQYKDIQLPSANVLSNGIKAKVLEINDIPVSEPIKSTPNFEGEDEWVFEMQPDLLGAQNYYRLEHSSGQFIEGNTYPNFQSSETFRDTICVPQGCYTVTLFDAVGNGICCGNGEGVFNVYKNGELVWTAPQFTYETSHNSCEVVGIFNFMGEEIKAIPAKGFYIQRYSDGSSTKHYRAE